MIQKQAIPINFAKGINTKVDPKQIQIGEFLSLQNTVFDEIGLLKKRNGFAALPSLSTTASYLSTFNGNLSAVGSTISAYSSGSKTWVNKSGIQHVSLSTLPLVRNSLNQNQCDAAVSSSGLVCTVYTEFNGSTNAYKYAIADSVTGQNIINPTVLSASASGSPRVFVLGGYFVIVFTVSTNLEYIAVSIANPTVSTAAANIAAGYAPTFGLTWDGVVAGSNLYIAYNTTSGGQSINFTYLSQSTAAVGGTPVAPTTFAASICTIMSVGADTTNPTAPVIYASFYDSASNNGFSVAVDKDLNKLMTPTQFVTTPSKHLANITCVAQNGVCTIFYESLNVFSFDSSSPNHGVSTITVTLPATVTTGTVGTRSNVSISCGLASKTFIVNGGIYVLVEFQTVFQPTYFLLNPAGNIIAKLGYQNGFFNSNQLTQAYLPLGLPSVTLNGNTASFSYLFKDLVEPVSKLNTGIPGTAQNPIQSTNIYSQTGVNLATVVISDTGIDSAEIGSNLNISGGFLSAYDGTQITEQNFFTWPENMEGTWHDTGGSIVAKPDGATNASAYWYQFTYEWTDNQGNIQRSAPSVPYPITTTGAGSAGSVVFNIPTLDNTYKANVKIVAYRWSVGQQVYYQATSISVPILNNATTDSVTFTDTSADSSILGGNIIYTTGGVVENVNPPACDLLTLFDDRLWLVDAEDKNLLWYSKQVIEATPVEMSDLFTFYVAPTIGAQGSTGVITALSVMDDKLIIFKKDAIYYINGSGPDNTGSNNGYNGPIFITSTVGCSIQHSVVFTPDGLMFQSDKGIWLLGRDLSVSYIGAAVESFTASATVVSALGIPKTNQVRFTLDSGLTLMYDYFVGQWGTFVGIPGVSSTLYQGLHTFINKYGQVLQESPGTYRDGASPVLLGFKTGWIQLQGISGYQRIYELQLVGEYVSPHLLNVQLGYDFGPLSEQALIQPLNFTGVYGSSDIYGQTDPYGGPGTFEQWRIQPSTQKCQAFQISLEEVYDSSHGGVPGAGFTLSAMTCVLGINRSYRPVKAATTVGTS